LTLFLVVIDGLDDGDNGDGYEDGYAFDPFYLVRGSGTETLVEAKGK